MKIRMKQKMLLAGAVCMLSVWMAGCSLGTAAAGTVSKADATSSAGSAREADETSPTGSAKETDETSPTAATGGADDISPAAVALSSGSDAAQTADAETGTAQDVAGEDTLQGTAENSVGGGGKWHVFDPKVAALVDADFEGTVRRIDADSFVITETQVAVLDDGSLVASSLSSKAEVPESDLIRVVCDDDTHFYVRTIYGNGEKYEDRDAGFQDLEEDVSVQMKGRFENDVFYADEIRIVKIS